MAELDIHRVMAGLAERRPIFHSEADFQFAFAWQIATMKRDGKVRLEKPFSLGGKRMHLDIWLPTSNAAIELKYRTRRLCVKREGEEFALKSHEAQDHGRHDFIADIVRIQRVRAKRRAAGNASAPGYAILLTNDHLYWRPGKDDAADKDFHLHEGRILSGTLTWAKHANNATKKGRDERLDICKSCRLHWKPYSSLEDEYGEFRYLAVKVE